MNIWCVLVLAVGVACAERSRRGIYGEHAGHALYAPSHGHGYAGAGLGAGLISSGSLHAVSAPSLSSLHALPAYHGGHGGHGGYGGYGGHGGLAAGGSFPVHVGTPGAASIPAFGPSSGPAVTYPAGTVHFQIGSIYPGAPAGALQEIHTVHVSSIPVRTIEHRTPVAVPQPYPVTVERRVPVQVPVPVHVPVNRPVEVPVPKPYNVFVDRPVPYVVEKRVPYPVKVQVKVPVQVPVHVDVPQPYPVKVEVPQKDDGGYHYDHPHHHTQHAHNSHPW